MNRQDGRAGLAAITGYDHTDLRVHDATVAHAGFLRLGFLPAEPSLNRLEGIASCAIALDDGSYLAFSGPAHEVPAQRHSVAVGLNAALLRAAGRDDAVAALAAAGVPVRKAFDFSRPVTVGGAERIVTFRLATLPTGLADDDMPEIELIEHATPDLIWRRDLMAHPNGVIGTAEVALAVADPTALAPLYAVLVGAANVRCVPDGLEIATGTARITYLTPARLEAAFPGAAQASLGGRAGAIIFRVRDEALLRRVLAEAGVTPAALPGGGLALPPGVLGTAGLIGFHT